MFIILGFIIVEEVECFVLDMFFDLLFEEVWLMDIEVCYCL